MSRYIDADKIKWREEKDQIFGRDIVFAELWQVNEIPTADVKEVKHGIWYVIHDEDWFGGGRYECSECGYGFSFGGFHEMDEQYYCPHCGAEMEVENKED